jgi:hypothetical protein
MGEWIEGAPLTDACGNFSVGVLLQVRDHGMVLVGHINGVSGVCNDCTADIAPEDVERHQIVWRPESSS